MKVFEFLNAQMDLEYWKTLDMRIWNHFITGIATITDLVDLATLETWSTRELWSF